MQEMMCSLLFDTFGIVLNRDTIGILRNVIMSVRRATELQERKNFFSAMKLAGKNANELTFQAWKNGTQMQDSSQETDRTVSSAK